MRQPLFLYLALAVCTPVSAFAAQAKPAAAAPDWSPIDKAQLSETTRILSSDAFEGRAPGTPGEARTIAYLVDRFRKLGLQPAGDDGGWTQAVPLLHTQIDTAPPVTLPKAPVMKEPIAKETKPTPSPAAPAAAKETKPTPPAVTPAVVKETKPAPVAAAAPASPSRRTFMVQIAAFKNAKQAGQLAERVKRDGYHADVRRIESSAVPYVVRVGGYASREQAESAREALARKGFKGFIL